MGRTPQALILGLLVLACGHSTTLPTLPTVLSGDKDLPIIVNWPLKSVGASGSNFLINGKPTPLKGAVICCYDAYTLSHGWPLIDAFALREIASHGGNYTHIRSLAAEEQVGWDAYPPLLQLARELGIVVEVDVLDGWVIRNGFSGTGGCQEFQSYPRTFRQSWIRAIVQVTGEFPNVIYQTSNEGFVCNSGKEWELGIRDAIREAEKELGYRSHLIGTNSERPDLEGEFDYSTWHSTAPVQGGPVPRLVNETRDQDVNPEEYKRNLENACAIGTSYTLWRGLMDDQAWEKSLGYMKEGCK